MTRTRFFFTTAVLLAVAIVATYAPNPVYATTYFQDTFDRADQSGWGSASDGSGSWTAASCAGSGGSVSISSNTGVISGNNNGDCATSHALGTQSDIVMTFTFTTSNSFTTAPGDAGYTCIKNDGTRRFSQCYGIIYRGTGTTVQIVDNGGTALATGSFTFSNSTAYDIEIDVDTNYWMDVYIWAHGGSKPGTATASFHNGGSAYSPVSTGSNTSFGFISNSASTNNITWDSLLVSSPTVASVAPSGFYNFLLES